MKPRKELRRRIRHRVPNEKDLAEGPSEVRDRIRFVLPETVDDVLAAVPEAPVEAR